MKLSPTLSPHVSVVIPAYNAGHWLVETLRSVLNQSFGNIEAIVVDDGSTDTTRQVVQSMRDRRIRYLYQCNKGLSAARNTGIRACRGCFVALLDADDLFKPDKLSRQIAAFDEEPELGLVTCGYELIDNAGVRIGEERHWQHHPILELSTLLFWNPLLPSTLMVRREWFERGGLFDESLQRYEDWELAVRFAARGCRMKYVRDVLVSYRRHDTNMSTAAQLVPVATNAAVRFMTDLFDDPDLDEGVRGLRNAAFSNVYLDAAARAFGSGLGAQGRVWLETAIEYDDALLTGYPPRWLDALCGHAFHGLVGDRDAYVDALVANQPRARSTRPFTAREVYAQLSAVRAFKDYYQGSRQSARAAALRALILNPSLVRNKGLLTLGLRPR